MLQWIFPPWNDTANGMNACRNGVISEKKNDCGCRRGKLLPTDVGVLTVDAQSFRLKEWNFGGRIVGFTAVACLIVRHIGQDGELGRYGFVCVFGDRVDLEGMKKVDFMLLKHKSTANAKKLNSCEKN